MRLISAAPLILLASCNSQRALPNAWGKAGSDYARDHPAGRYQMVVGEGLHAVFVLDTTTGKVTACNMDLGYQTWCGIPAMMQDGKGPNLH